MCIRDSGHVDLDLAGVHIEPQGCDLPRSRGDLGHAARLAHCVEFRNLNKPPLPLTGCGGLERSRLGTHGHSFLSPVLRGVWQLLDELADNSRSHFAVCRYRLLNRLVWEAPHFMTPFSLSEKDPALGLHELDHVSVLLRLRHNYILGPPRL